MVQTMNTTISVSRQTRDRLARIAKDELRGASMDEALKVILFQHESSNAIARLNADPEALADYQHDMADLADRDQVIHE